jgi:hypothetical protein
VFDVISTAVDTASPPAVKDSRGGGSGLRACLDDAGVLPESRYIRKEKMLSRAIFRPTTRKCFKTRRESTQAASIPAKPVVSQLELSLVKNLNLTIPPLLVLLRNDLHHQTEAFIAVRYINREGQPVRWI